VIAGGIAGGGYLLSLIPDGSASDPDRFGAQIGRTMSGHDHVVTLAVGELDGRPIAVSGGSFGDETLRLWDLTGRRQVGDTVDLDRGFLEDRGSFSVATATVSGRSVAVSGNTADTELWVWDLAAGDRMFRMDGHERAVSAVATASLAGRPVAVSGSLGGTLRIWDLTSGTQIGEPLTGHTAKVEEITIGELDGRTVAVSAADDSTVRVWDLAAGEPAGGPIAAEVGESLTGYTSWISALAVTEVDGRPVAVTAGGNPHLGSEALLWIWDLATGERVREIVTDHTSWIGSVAISRQGARTLAVTASQDTTLRVWDLATGDPVGEPFTGPEEGVRAVVTGTVDGRTVAVSGDSGGTVRLWNITLPDPSAAPPGGTTAG
jgi:WD40 repeat protein